MPVIGKNAYIISIIGETVDVAPFAPDYKPIRVELVDAALKYESPNSGEMKILIIRKGLLVPSMTNNELPPFVLGRLESLSMKSPRFMYPHQQRSIMQYIPRDQFSHSFVIEWHIFLFSHKQARYQVPGRT